VILIFAILFLILYMLILGIDPGLAITGYALVQVAEGQMTAVDFGVIRTDKERLTTDRLLEIYDGVRYLIDAYRPDVMAVESLFFYNNQKTAMKVGQARGVVMLAGRQAKMDFYEYTPKQVKQAVVGYGVADKKQVQYMIKQIFTLTGLPQPDDAADALGVCYVCAINL